MRGYHLLDFFFCATRVVTLSIEELDTMSINNLTGISLGLMPSLSYTSSSLEGTRFSNFLCKCLVCVLANQDAILKINWVSANMSTV